MTRTKAAWRIANTLTTLLVLFATLMLATPAHADSIDGCYITPVPVTLGQPWTIHASGLMPNSNYYTNTTQAHDPSNGAHPQSILSTDIMGTGQVDYSNTSPSPDLVLAVGTAQVRIYPARGWPGNAQGTVKCKFEIVS